MLFEDYFVRFVAVLHPATLEIFGMFKNYFQIKGQSPFRVERFRIFRSKDSPPPPKKNPNYLLRLQIQDNDEKLVTVDRIHRDQTLDLTWD